MTATIGAARGRAASAAAASTLLAGLTGPATVAVEPPGLGDGYWAGGPSAVLADGDVYLAYRLRRPVTAGRGFANVVARSADGVRFRPVATLAMERFDCASLERPALVQRPDGGWRLYVSCSTAGSKHWWVEAVDADDPAGLATGARTVVLAGDTDTAWKDVVVRVDESGWSMWACRHLLDAGDDEADRMQSWYLTSDDGLNWTTVGPALLPTPGSWDQRGTRITSVVPTADGWLATYDGRASAAENWYERTGFAFGAGPASFTAFSGAGSGARSVPTPRPGAGPVTRDGRTLRYVCVLPDGDDYRLFFEADRLDGSNALYTSRVAAG